MKPFTALGVTLVVLLAGSPVRAGDERLDIDPAVQGVWLLHATSKDEGKTIDLAKGEVFCRVTATKVKFPDGQELVAEKIHIVRDADGNPGNLIRFHNGTIWAVTKKPGQEFILVQRFEPGKDGKTLKEAFRILVSVSD
jgi:hypothetical protein